MHTRHLIAAALSPATAGIVTAVATPSWAANHSNAGGPCTAVHRTTNSWSGGSRARSQ